MKYMEQTSFNNELTREISELQEEVLRIRELPQTLLTAVTNCKDTYNDLISGLEVMPLLVLFFVITVSCVLINESLNINSHLSLHTRILYLMGHLEYSLQPVNWALVFSPH